MDFAQAEWVKSSRSSGSGSSDCVEVARNLPGVVGVRDSKNPTGPALAITPTGWVAFLGAVKDGGFDRA